MPDSLPSHWQEDFKPQGVALGFDYGTQKMGVAVGQLLTCTASPLAMLYLVKEEIDWVRIAALIKEWRPFALVVGIPVYMDDKPQWITEKATHFALELKKRFQVPVYVTDERLTSKEARSQIFESGGYKALKKSAIDSLAAKLILEQWLQQFNSEE